MSVTSLACTGSGDGASGFGPLGPTTSAVAWMDSVLAKMRRLVSAARFPTCFSQMASTQRSWGHDLALIGTTTQRDY
jgi:hypothetical protein